MSCIVRKLTNGRETSKFAIYHPKIYTNDPLIASYDFKRGDLIEIEYMLLRVKKKSIFICW